MSVTFGESLVMTGRLVAPLTAATTFAASTGSVPKTMPPFLTLGHDILTSMAATPACPSSLLATSAYSSIVSPNMLATTLVSIPSSRGSFSEMNASTPTFCRPMALSIPHGVSTMRGAGLPCRGFRESPFTTIAPRREMSVYGMNSLPYPKVPEAVITGFFSLNEPISTTVLSLSIPIRAHPSRWRGCRIPARRSRPCGSSCSLFPRRPSS